MITIYHDTKHKNTFCIPSHYGHSLQVIKDILEEAKQAGLTVPNKDQDININVLGGEKHKGQISVEFESVTTPTTKYINLEIHPHMSKYLVY